MAWAAADRPRAQSKPSVSKTIRNLLLPQGHSLQRLNRSNEKTFDINRHEVMAI